MGSHSVVDQLKKSQILELLEQGKLREAEFMFKAVLKENNKIVIPKDFKEKFKTFQRKFGTSVDELNE